MYVIWCHDMLCHAILCYFVIYFIILWYVQSLLFFLNHDYEYDFDGYSMCSVSPLSLPVNLITLKYMYVVFLLILFYRHSLLSLLHLFVSVLLRISSSLLPPSLFITHTHTHTHARTHTHTHTRTHTWHTHACALTHTLRTQYVWTGGAYGQTDSTGEHIPGDRNAEE